MTILMDDPTTYLKRDDSVLCVMYAETLARAQDVCRMYGVAIQVQQVGPGTTGVRVATNYIDALLAVVNYPANTPWCVVAGDHDFRAINALTIWFGKPKVVAEALGVVTDGIAWRPDKYPVN